MQGSRYDFEFQDSKNNFSYFLEAEPFDEQEIRNNLSNCPEWTRLNCHQCPHCPLWEHEVCCCPPALNMVSIVERFSECNSFDCVTLHATIGNQKFSTVTDLQSALAYIFPLIVFNSACPYAPLLRPLVKFIKPFPDVDDIMFYVLAFDLIRSRIRAIATSPSNAADEDGISKDPYSIAIAFHGLLNRLRTASHSDANINGIIKDIQWSYNISQPQKHILHRIRPYFFE